MKKLLYIGFAFMAFAFISCKKCQTCTTTTTQTTGVIIPIVVSISDEYCGDEYDNAPAEVSVNQNVGGISQTVVVDCVES
ncbi:MAG: hypothetical protein QNK23_02755 [Crocinitomicaceae bacterium]|nr:hypothetical protein [Crocinitomicaceae bacterium]